MATRRTKLTGKQPATLEITRRDHSTDILHYHHIGISEFRSFTCGEYHSDLLLIGAIYR